MSDTPRCQSCKITMQPGMALQQTWVAGELDFPGDEHPVTFSAGGPGKMTDCWKCPQCGRSIEMTDLQDLLDAARKHVDAMTPEERDKMWEEQRASWVRAMTTGCEHGVLDFEQCPQCRGENT